MHTSALSKALSATLLALLATHADAAPTGYTERVVSQNAPGICNANNPANLSNLRFLLSGLKNAGTTSVSVVCSKFGDDLAPAAMSSAYVYFRNDKAVAGTVTCTLATGSPYYGQYNYTKTLALEPGAGGGIFWNDGEYGTSDNNQWVNLQCSLPPGWQMREIGSNYLEYIGT